MKRLGMNELQSINGGSYAEGGKIVGGILAAEYKGESYRKAGETVGYAIGSCVDTAIEKVKNMF